MTCLRNLWEERPPLEKGHPEHNASSINIYNTLPARSIPAKGTLPLSREIPNERQHEQCADISNCKQIYRDQLLQTGELCSQSKRVHPKRGLLFEMLHVRTTFCATISKGLKLHQRDAYISLQFIDTGDPLIFVSADMDGFGDIKDATRKN